MSGKRDQQFRPLILPGPTSYMFPVRAQPKHQYDWFRFRPSPRAYRLERAQMFQSYARHPQ
jgi:hypothetical protein